MFESVLPFKSSDTNFSCGSFKYLETFEVIGEPFGGCCRSSFILRSAEIRLELIFGTWSPGVPCCFRLKVDFRGLFSCAFVLNTQISLH